MNKFFKKKRVRNNDDDDYDYNNDNTYQSMYKEEKASINFLKKEKKE